MHDIINSSKAKPWGKIQTLLVYQVVAVGRIHCVVEILDHPKN